VIVGAGTTTKSAALVAVPMVFVTLILPVVAPVGTVAVIDVCRVHRDCGRGGGVELDRRRAAELRPGDRDDRADRARL
jgi:hypothetical protein